MAIFIIITIIAVAVILIYRFFNRDSVLSKIRTIIHDHPKQVRTLLGKEVVADVSSLTDEEKHTILGMTNEDWMEWEQLIRETLIISKQNPFKFDDFIEETWPDVYSRPGMPKDMFVDPVKKRTSVIHTLTLEELRLICSQTEEDWKKRMRIISLAGEIRRANQDGLRIYLEQNGGSAPTNKTLVRERKAIEYYQQAYSASKRYKEWERRQGEFCTIYRQIVRDCYPNAFCSSYDISYKCPSAKGDYSKSSYKVWQTFVNAYSLYYVDRLPAYCTETCKFLPEFKNQNRHFVDWVFQSILKIIKSSFEQSGGTGLVVFVTNSAAEWPITTYAYHYSDVKKLLSNEGVPYCDIQDLCTIDDTTRYDSVVMIDFITKNDEISTNCNLVVDYFNKNIPCIGYFSFVKEYSEEETKTLVKNTPAQNLVQQPIPAPQPINEQEEISFLKSKFERIKIGGAFAFSIIPNTLIGTAVNAPYVKPVWLHNADRYHIEMIKSTSGISCKYSCPGVIGTKNFSTQGNRNNLDAVVEFTYRLFKLMGVWDQFKQRGENAIQTIIKNRYVM